MHGVTEDADQSANSRRDKQFLDNLIKNLHVKTTYKHLSRIGNYDPEKTRPIKVAISSEAEKRSLFKNLSNLKQYPQYKGVSLTDDFTPAERGVLKDWIEKAKERNKSETDVSVIWKVRGSPKNRLFLKKFPKTKTV